MTRNGDQLKLVGRGTGNSIPNSTPVIDPGLKSGKNNRNFGLMQMRSFD
jgi:hypothetical protein